MNDVAKKSPLNDVEEEALDVLLSRDPEGLSKEDTDKLIALLVPKLRAERKAFEEADAEAHKKGKHGRGPKRELPEGANSIYDLKLD